MMNENSIELYFHCQLCVLDDDITQDIEVGLTDMGLQIWCRIHDCNVVHIDFENYPHPMDDTRKVIPRVHNMTVTT